MNRKQIFTLCALALALSLVGCQADAFSESEDSSYELVAKPDTASHEQEPYDLVAEPSTGTDANDGFSSSDAFSSSSSLDMSSSSVAGSSSAAEDGVVYCYVSSIDRCLSSDEEDNEALTETYCALVSGTVVSSCDGYQ